MDPRSGSGQSLLVLGALFVARTPSSAFAVAAVLATLLLLAGSMLALFPIGVLVALAYLGGWLWRLPLWGGVGLISVGLIAPIFQPAAFTPSHALSVTALCVGGIAVPAIRRGLSSPLSAWLGRISFPLYLVHAPVMGVMARFFDPAMGTAAMLAFWLGTAGISVALAIMFEPVNSAAVRLSRAAGSAAVTMGRRAAMIEGRRAA
jgi:peptidoglycan/LPS O-acetylase OafA/YrhL